ncbi:unnamed protein product, partial [Laminaria digitata]
HDFSHVLLPDLVLITTFSRYCLFLGCCSAKLRSNNPTLKTSNLPPKRGCSCRKANWLVPPFFSVTLFPSILATVGEYYEGTHCTLQLGQKNPHLRRLGTILV